MHYELRQRGRAAIDFLADLRTLSDRLEADTDVRAHELIAVDELPEEPEALQSAVAPTMEALAPFRVLRLCRDWTLDRHGRIAMDAFDEMRTDIEDDLQMLRSGPTTLKLAPGLSEPDYWTGVEFHRSAGGWDGHDYMGFVHGELIHNRMVNAHLAGIIYAVRKRVAEAARERINAERILEVGCCSGQYTQGLAEVFPEADICACDLSARQLEQAQRFANERGLSWTLFQAAGEDLRVEDAQFDLVTSYAMFHEIPTQAAAAHLREYRRVLRPGGWVVIGDVKAYRAFDPYNRWKNDYWNQVHGGDPHWRAYAESDLAALARDAGFVDARWEGLDDGGYPFVLTARKEDTA